MKRRRRGLTLLESLLTAFILIMVFFAVVSLYPSSILSLRKAHDLVTASTLATQALEQQRSLEFASLQPGTVTTTQALDGTQFTLTRTIADSGSDVKILTLQVAWSSAPLAQAGQVQSTLNYEAHFYNFRE